MIVARTTELAEQLLGNGELRCPRCRDGQLAAWGYGLAAHRARPRRPHHHRPAPPHPMPVLLIDAHRDARRITTTPRRHHRRDRNSVATRLGHRRIAVAIDRPVSTVRRWLRRLPPSHVERIYRDGTKHLLALDPDTFTALRNTANMLHHALSILSAAAYWDRHRYGLNDPPWTLIGVYTRGRLLAPPG